MGKKNAVKSASPKSTKTFIKRDVLFDKKAVTDTLGNTSAEKTIPKKHSLLSAVKNISLTKYLLFGFLFFVAVTVVINSGRYSKSVFSGLKLYVFCVMPSLLPFFFLTAMLSRIPSPPFLDKMTRPFTEKLLGLCSDAFTMILISFLSGNPVGAKLISEYHKKQNVTEKQLLTLCAVCSMTSPIFIISTVGMIFFESRKIGWFLFVIQLVSSIINGILFKCQNENPMNILKGEIEKAPPYERNSEKTKPNLIILSDSIAACVSSTLTVGAYITVFYLFTDILTDIGLINFLSKPVGLLFSAMGISTQLSTPVVLSLFEVTRGLGELAAVSVPLRSKLILSSCMLSFSGLSIIFQSYNFLGGSGISFKKLFLTKITHVLISLAVTVVFLAIFTL